jgi:hypothetical protein
MENNKMLLLLYKYIQVTLHTRAQQTNKTNYVALVHEWTIPTEQSPLVGEVSANFFG